ncbi:MAG: type VI secretion system baseplate subunit TssF [Paracoccus sp. (in: a-proteobacteria)]|nr:type VI secretion system baseplate subunit TssF [Paracoccus sp. (in: a-proteobacteria)]
MKKAFRDAYERELDILYERTAEFAEEYPGLADRLGGMLRDNIDPTVAGLLEGTAFMAARVQMKLDEEFRGFTTELLEQIFPDALAPVPSCMLVEAQIPETPPPDFGVAHYPRGATMEAPFRDADKRIVCRFSLAAPLTVLPLRIERLTYHDRTAPIGGLGQDPDPATRAALQIDLRHVTGRPLSVVDVDRIDFHLSADMAQAAALYEQIQCGVVRASLRWQLKNGDPRFLRLKPDQIDQIGFDSDELLFDRDSRLFEGFALLRDFFVFPRKFLGFRLNGVKKLFSRLKTDEAQLILEFDRSDADLARQLGQQDLRLNSAAAVNLFEERSNQIRLGDKHSEYVVTPDSARLTQIEVHRILDVHASAGNSQQRTQVFPLYALPPATQAPRAVYYYTTRRKPRRLTAAERRGGLRSDYRGTETFISLYEPPLSETGQRAQRLHLRTLCSNRHLPITLPLSRSDDLHMDDDQKLRLRCVSGPTPPREAMTETERAGPHRTQQGDVYWRLISYLSLNHFGLDDRFGRDGAASLREILSLFADLSDNVTQSQIAGITHLAVRPVTRSVRRPEGFFPARGLEISITYDETAFEGSGIIPLAAVLDRFFAEYISINSFSQTVTISKQRGQLRRWPPRSGRGPLL